MRVELDDDLCIALGEVQRLVHANEIGGQVGDAPGVVWIGQVFIREDGWEWIEPLFRIAYLLP